MAVTCPSTWMLSAKSPLPGEPCRSGQLQGMAQPRSQGGSEKLHWEEEVIRPVIFGKKYDPLKR